MRPNSPTEEPRWPVCSLLPVLISLSIAWLAMPAAAQDEVPSEYQVKAAYLYNFARFVQWPREAFAAPDSPLHICVLGEDRFGPDLTQTVDGKLIDGRPLRVLTLPSARPARSCHILFISSSESKKLKQIVAEVNGASVLTVGESNEFIQQGGMINFKLLDERVRFEVNLRAAEAARLKISSKLLSIATAVQM